MEYFPNTMYSMSSMIFPSSQWKIPLKKLFEGHPGHFQSSALTARSTALTAHLDVIELSDLLDGGPRPSRGRVD